MNVYFFWYETRTTRALFREEVENIETPRAAAANLTLTNTNSTRTYIHILRAGLH